MPRIPRALGRAPGPNADPVDVRLDRVLGYQLAFASLTTDAVFARVVGAPLQLRPVEYTVLALIREHPGVSPGQLADALAVTPPNITAWLGRLETRGFLDRSTSPTDRRAWVLRLTPAGERASADATRRLVAAEHEALAGLSPGELAMLGELLRKVAAARPAVR
jgi:DNA-binding MarR family transcriptional regulator